MLLVAPQQPPSAGRPVIPGRGGMLWTAPPVAPGTGLWGLPQGPGFPPPTPGYNLPPSAMVTSSRGGGAGVAMRHTLVPHGPAGGSLVQASPPPPGVSPAYDPTQKSHKNKFTHFKLPAESSSPTQPLAFTYTGAVPSATTKNAIRVEDRAAPAGEPQRSPRPPRSHRRRGESPRSSSSSDAASPRHERHRRHRRRRAAKGGEAPSNPPERHSRAAEEKKPASSPARRSHSAPLPSEQPPPRKDSRHRHSRRRESAAAPRERAEKGGRPERRHRHRRKGAGAVAEVAPDVPPPVPASREAPHRSRRHRRVEEGGESGAPRHPRRRHRGGPHRDKESSPTTKKAVPMPQRKHSKRSEPDAAGRPPLMPSAARRHRRASHTSSSSSSESVTRSSRSLSDRGRRGILRSEELSQPQGKTTSKSRQDGHENEKKPKKRNFLFRFLHLTPSSRRDSGVAPKNEMDNPPPTPGRHAGHNIPPHIQQQSAHLHQPPSIPTPKPLRIPSV